MNSLLTILIIAVAICCTFAAPHDEGCNSEVCDSELSPICGKPQDGTGELISFYSHCFMDNIHNCLNRGNRYELYYYGPCSESEPAEEMDVQKNESNGNDIEDSANGTDDESKDV